MLKLERPHEVYAEVEGRLVELNVKNGDWVKKDTVLAKLSNPSKEKELLERTQDHDVAWYKARYFGQSYGAKIGLRPSSSMNSPRAWSVRYRTSPSRSGN